MSGNSAYAPMLMPLVALVSGILCGIAGAGWQIAIGLTTAGVALYITILKLSKNPLAGFRLAPLHHLWVFLVFSGIGIADFDLSRPFKIDERIEDIIAAEGRIESVTHRTTGDEAVMEVNKLIDGSSTGIRTQTCRIILRSDALPYGIDDTILVKSPLKEISESANSLTSGYATRMNNDGIYYQTTCEGKDIMLTGHDSTLKGLCMEVRDRLESYIENSPLSKATQNFLITILLGDRRYLTPHTRDLFADAGLSHMLALSGMHVAIMAGIMMWLLFPLNFAGLYKYRILAAAIAMIGYAMLTGLAPSTVRAAVMMLALSVSMVFERKNSAWNSLLLATFCILLFSPNAVLDVGLQLSFTCVAAIIFMVKPLNPISQHDHPWFYKACGAIITTLVATLATWCLSAYYFGIVPVVFLGINLITLPLLPPYLVASLIYLCFSTISTVPEWTTNIIDFFPELLEKLVSAASAEGTTAVHFSPNGLTVGIWLLIIVAAAMWINGIMKKKMKYAAIALLPIFAVSLAFPAEAGEDMIVRSGIDRICIAYLTQRGEETVEMPRFKISEIEIKGKRIISIDTKDGRPGSRRKCDFLILGGSGPKDMKNLMGSYEAGIIVLHPTIRRADEERMIIQADSMGMEIYSIRRSGPYRTRLSVK